MPAPAPDPVSASSGAAPSHDVFVDDRGLAQYIPSISRQQWQRMRYEGSGPPYYKIGSRCLYKVAETLAWVEARRVGGPK